MQIPQRRPSQTIALTALTLLALTLASLAPARAQEIEPGEFTPLPDHINVNLLYYVHGTNDRFVTTAGHNTPGSNLEVNVGVERFVRYQYIAGMPAGFQVYQLAGAESGRLGGAGLGSSVGASNTALSAFIWPYANKALNQYLILAAFLYPPDGSYDKTKSLNLASALSGWQGWTGDLQSGWEQAIGQFSYDAAADVRFFGSTTGPIQPSLPVSVRSHKDTDLRLQLWLNWKWNEVLTTSVGYQGFFGGDAYFDNPLLLGGVGHTNVGSSREHRIRAAATFNLAQQLHVVLEANHDIARTGGFQQDWGLTLRVAYLF